MDSIEDEPPLRIPSPPPETKSPVTLSADALRKLHANLESRLQPFWSSVLSSRTIRLHLFASPHHLPSQSPARTESADDRAAEDYGPVTSQDVVTAADGSFQAKFTVKWEELCQHPGALHIAFGNRSEEHDLLIAAQLLPVPITPPSSASSGSSDYQDQMSRAQQAAAMPKTALPSPTVIRISISHSPIRVISDIDDTVKLSNILSGARAVFQNVFVKDLEENIIPGMGEWYTEMWSRGIRFHYVVSVAPVVFFTYL